jgi:TonB family protein
MQITLRVCGLSLAAAAVVASSGRAAEMRQPDWLRRPKSEDILAVYPREAMQRGIGGTATISCIVTVQGGLRACTVSNERPAGAGFGAAALALTPQFLLRPATRDGAPVESGINIPIRFEWSSTATSFIPGAGTTRASGVERVYSGPLAWSQAPSVADVLAAYPQKAKERKAGGRVSLECRFTAAGKLADCLTMSEEPSGLGFGHAARQLADRFQGPTQDADGHAMTGGHTLLAFAFAAETLDASTPVIGKPGWTALPKPADLAAALPAQAKAAGVLQARVLLRCVVGDAGALTGCAVETEAPGDLGYGAAALTLAGRFRVGLWTEEGLPTIGGVLRLPIRFDFAPPPAAPKP